MSKKPKQEENNPHLQAAILEVVDNQLNANDPPETRQTLDRLIAQGISREDAKIYIAQAVCLEIYHVLKHKTLFDQVRYLKNLHNLPEEPKE